MKRRAYAAKRRAFGAVREAQWRAAEAEAMGRLGAALAEFCEQFEAASLAAWRRQYGEQP